MLSRIQIFVLEGPVFTKNGHCLRFLYIMCRKMLFSTDFVCKKMYILTKNMCGKV